MLKLGYLSLSLLVLILISSIGFYAIQKSFPDPSKVKKKKTTLIVILLMWILYTFGIASTGILQNYELPPRFPIFLILPAFLFTGIFIYKNRNYSWIQNIPPHWLIYYQTFRILIESLFVVSVAEGVLHSRVTIEGYNFDMIYALTAPIIAFLAFQMKKLSIRAVILWNYLGLLVITSIIFLFLTTVFYPELYGKHAGVMPTDFATFPYVLVASFLMPSAVFMHVLSIVQLTKR